MVVQHTHENEDQEVVPGESHGMFVSVGPVERVRDAQRSEYRGILGSPSLTESPPTPEEPTLQSISALQEGAKRQYHDLFALTRLSPEENEKFQKYLNVPYESLKPDEQGYFDVLRAKAAGLDQAEIEDMMSSRKRLHEAIARGEVRSPALDIAEQTYLRLWDKAKARWEDLSQSV